LSQDKVQGFVKPAVDRASPAGFLRRLGAACYDALLLLAVWFFATALLLPLNGGEAFRSGQWWFPLYLLAISFLFYGWFWTHGGQTLGLKAWRLKLCSSSGRAIGWKQAAIRFCAAALSWACFGLGFMWCLFDPEALAWHDRLSGTRLLHLPAEKPGSEK